MMLSHNEAHIILYPHEPTDFTSAFNAVQAFNEDRPFRLHPLGVTLNKRHFREGTVVTLLYGITHNNGTIEFGGETVVVVRHRRKPPQSV